MSAKRRLLSIVDSAENGIKKICSQKLVVGVLGDFYYDNGESVKDIAAINIKGTSKIPSRDFVKFTFSQHSEEWGAMLKRAFSTYGNRKVKSGANKGWTSIGRAAASDMKKTLLTKSLYAGNAPSTIREKGFDHPLLHTRILVNSISFRIRNA